MTRRETPADDISVPALNRHEARQILDRDLKEPCPESTLDALTNTAYVSYLAIAFSEIGRAAMRSRIWAGILVGLGAMLAWGVRADHRIDGCL